MQTTEIKTVLLTLEEIEELTTFNKKKLSHYSPVAYFECLIGKSKQFRWFINDDGVYLYTNNKSLKHIGSAVTFRQFTHAVFNYLMNENEQMYSYR